MKKKPKVFEVTLSGRNILIEDGDGIEISRNNKMFFLTCCKCELKHIVDIKWKENSVVLYFKRVECPIRS